MKLTSMTLMSLCFYVVILCGYSVFSFTPQLGLVCWAGLPAFVTPGQRGLDCLRYWEYSQQQGVHFGGVPAFEELFFWAKFK